MNTHEPNSSELDGESVHNALINLGPVTTTLVLFMYEIDGTPMSGTTGIDSQAFGNLTRVIQLGSGLAGINLAVTGDLIRDPHVLLGTVASSISFSATGTMYLKSMMGEVSTGISFAASSTIHASVLMSGRTNISFSATGALTQYVKKALPTGTTGIDLAISGTLAGYARMGAVSASISFDVEGLLSTLIFLHGSTCITFDVGGSLFNNPSAEDPDGYTLIRPFVDRLLVRRS